MRTSSLLAFGIAAILGAPATARALELTPTTVPFSNYVGAYNATLEFLGVSEGVPPSGEVLTGSIGASDPTVLMRLTITEGISAGAGCIGLLATVGGGDTPWRPISGAGRIAAGGLAIGDLLVAAGGDGDSVSVCPEAGFELGEPTDFFFVAWPTLGVGDRIGGFFYTGPPRLTDPMFFGATVVPEPTTALLLGAALAALAALPGRR